MLPVMDVESHPLLVLDTSAAYAITLTIVKFAKRDLTMSIHSSRFKDQVMLQRLLLLPLMMISQQKKRSQRLNNNKNIKIIMATMVITDIMATTVTMDIMVTMVITKDGNIT